LAENHHVVGYVRNKSDGTVELEAEGPPTEVDQFLVDVQTEFGANISDQQRTTIEPRGKEASFEIRH
jgi:acylphosphatase